MPFRFLLILLLLPFFGYSQTQQVLPTGQTYQLTYQKGGYGADSVIGIPIRDTTNTFPTFRYKGRLTLRPQDGKLYFHDGNAWQQVGAGGAVIDSAVWVTITRLNDSMSVIRDSIAALRADIGTGGAQDYEDVLLINNISSNTPAIHRGSGNGLWFQNNAGTTIANVIWNESEQAVQISTTNGTWLFRDDGSLYVGGQIELADVPNGDANDSLLVIQNNAVRKIAQVSVVQDTAFVRDVAGTYPISITGTKYKNASLDTTQWRSTGYNDTRYLQPAALTPYKLAADSINPSGYATQWDIGGKLDTSRTTQYIMNPSADSIPSTLAVYHYLDSASIRGNDAGLMFGDSFKVAALPATYTSSFTTGGIAFPSSLYLQGYGGNGTFLNYVQKTQKSALAQSTSQIVFIPRVISATAFGMGIGFASDNFSTDRNLIAEFSVSSGSVVDGKVILYRGTTSLATSAGTLTYIVGDTLIGTLIRNDFVASAVYKNMRTGDSVTVSYTYPKNTAGNITNAVSSPRLYIFGDTCNVLKWTVESNQNKFSDLFLGDSELFGYSATTRAVDRLYNYNRNDYAIINGAGDRSTDVIKTFVEQGLHSPNNVFLWIGVNDIGTGVTIANFRLNIISIINSWIARNNKKINIISLPPLNANDVNQFNDTLKSLCKAYGLNYIDVYTPLKGTGTGLNPNYDAGDGVHLNDSGNYIVYTKLLPYKTTYTGSLNIPKYVADAIDEYNDAIVPTEFIRQGGNTFGVAMRIGTNDNFNVQLESNNAIVATANATGFAVGTAAPTTTLDAVGSSTGEISGEVRNSNTAGYEHWGLRNAANVEIAAFQHLNSTFASSGVIEANSTNIRHFGSGPLYIISATASGVPIKFVAGGTAAGNIRGMITPTGTWYMGANPTDLGNGREAQVNGQLGVTDSIVGASVVQGTIINSTAPPTATTMNIFYVREAGSNAIKQITPTGTPSSTTALHGDWSWKTPSGGGLSASNFAFNETPTGTINGVNTAFTLAFTPTSGKIQVWLNGLLQAPANYSVVGTTLTMGTAPLTGDELLVFYIH